MPDAILARARPNGQGASPDGEQRRGRAAGRRAAFDGPDLAAETMAAPRALQAHGDPADNPAGLSTESRERTGGLLHRGWPSHQDFRHADRPASSRGADVDRPLFAVS